MNTSESRPRSSAAATVRICGGFRLPVRDEDREVIEPEAHVGMPFERLARVCLVVLGTDREDDPSPFQLHEVLLEDHVGLPTRVATKAEILQPVLSNDAAPDGVVEIEHQALPRQSQGRRDHRRHVAREERDRSKRDPLLCHVPVARFDPRPFPDQARKPVAIDQKHRGAGGLTQTQIEHLGHRKTGAGEAKREVAKRRLGRSSKGELDDGGIEPACEELPERGPLSRSARFRPPVADRRSSPGARGHARAPQAV